MKIRISTPLKKMPFVSKYLFIPLLLILPVSLASAQEDEEDDAEDIAILSEYVVDASADSGYRATESLTATKIGTKLTNIPLNVNVITENFIDDLGMDIVGEALRYTSSAIFDENNSASGSTAIRGFGVQYIYRNGYQHRHSQSLSNVARVEVIKGPATMFFGQTRPGGIVNYITKTPNLRKGGYINYKFGSNNYNKIDLDYQTVVGNGESLGFRLVTSYRDSEDWRDFEFAKITTIAPSIRWRPMEKLNITLEYEYVKEESNRSNPAILHTQHLADYQNPPSAVVAFFKADQGFATDEETVDYLRGRWRVRDSRNWQADILKSTGVQHFRFNSGDASFLSPSGKAFNSGGPGQYADAIDRNFNINMTFSATEWFELRYGFSYQNVDTDEYQAFGFVAGDGTIPFRERNRLLRRNYDVHQIDGLFKFKLGPMKNKLLTGYQRSASADQSDSRGYDYSNVVPVFARDGTLLEGRQVYDRYDPGFHQAPNIRDVTTGIVNIGNRNTSVVESVYVSHQGELLNGKLHTLSGLRNENNLEGQSKTVPSAGFTYEFIPGFFAFASYSENFLPNGSNLTGPVDPSEVFNLAAEQGIGTDVGIKIDWNNSKLTGTFTYFTLDRENIRRRDFEAEEEDGRSGVRVFTISGLHRSEGIELDLIWTPNNNFQLLMGYSYIWEAKIVTDPQAREGFERDTQIGRRLNVPEHKFTAYGKYSFSEGFMKGLSIGTGVRYFGSTFGSTSSVVRDFFNPAFTQVDGSVSYETDILGYTAVLTITAENLFDQQSLQGNNNSWGDPRNLWFSTKIKF